MKYVAKQRTVVVGAALTIAAIAGACASAGMPPGGPPDVAPPFVVSISPLSMTTDPKVKNLEIKFSEVISETPKGAAELRQLVFISPRTGEEQVGWHRDRITIQPKGGFKSNTVYSVQLSPGIQDVRNNAIDTAIGVVFSTGGPIPTTSVTGVAFDWVLGRGANKALVEAIAKDSTTYQVLADTAGRFNLQYAPIGEYVIRAIVDRNANRLLDPTEAFDTVRITLTERADVELYAFPRDTVGLRIADIQLPSVDSLKVMRVTFDKPLSPAQSLSRPQFVVLDGDSARIEVVFIQTALEKITADSLAQKTKQDSIAAAGPRDTTAAGRARADSLTRRIRSDSIAAAERVQREARRLAARRGDRPPPPPDTMPQPKMKRPVVSPEVYLTLATRLKPGTSYRIRASGVISLSGTAKSPERTFLTPREVKRDTTDSASRRPPP